MATCVPECDHPDCTELSVWQIGAFIPFKATPSFYCDKHLPKGARKQVEAGNFTDCRPPEAAPQLTEPAATD
jgi:hypothetical protein